MDHEKAVADAAGKLSDAIEAAQRAGYRVDFPTYALGTIAISETKRVTPTAEPETPSVPVIGRHGSATEKATDPAA